MAGNVPDALSNSVGPFDYMVKAGQLARTKTILGEEDAAYLAQAEEKRRAARFTSSIAR